MSVTNLTTTDPDTWRQWRANFMVIVELNGWDNHRARLVAFASVEGKAKQALENIPHGVAPGVIPGPISDLLDLWESHLLPPAGGAAAK